MTCVLCGGRLVKTTEPITAAWLNARVVLSNIERSRCVSCEEEFFNPEQAQEYSEAVEKEYRIQTTLIGKDIARIRKKLKLSQAELETKLHLGNKVIVRWETDKVRLPGPVNALFKILDKRPKVIKFV